MLFGHTAVEVGDDRCRCGTSSRAAPPAWRQRSQTALGDQRYRTGSLQYRLMKRLAYLPWVGLPNILCGEEMVPEPFLWDDATPSAAWRQHSKPGSTTGPAVRPSRRVSGGLALRVAPGTGSSAAKAILPYLPHCADVAQQT